MSRLSQHRMHLVGLPHTSVSGDYPCCGFTQTLRKFCTMMTSVGVDVVLYANRGSTAACSEFVECGEPWPTDTYQTMPWVPHEKPWVEFNRQAVKEIRARMRTGDTIGIIGGQCQESIARDVPELLTVEYAVGYAGVFSPFKVFESQAWMHAVLAQNKNAAGVDGQFYSTVIPHFFNVDAYPVSARKDDYFLYFGRVNARKGVSIAEEVCERLGANLIIAGPPGDYTPRYGKVLGPVSDERRAQLMGRARALFVPTLYLGPFEGVAVEAMLCGTPAITTPWGAFTETVVPGFNGARCRSLKEFCDAAKQAQRGTLGESPTAIAAHARERYDMNVLKHAYLDYYNHLSTLRAKGWYEGAPRVPTFVPRNNLRRGVQSAPQRKRATP